MMSTAMANAADKLLVSEGSCTPKLSRTETMKAVTYEGASLLGAKRVGFGDHAKPLLTNEKDAIIQIQLSAISESDLNMYAGDVPTTRIGIVLGHEAVGIVDKVGSLVNEFCVGDRVVVSPNIACGECTFCSRGEFAECDTTNDTKLFGEEFGGTRGPAAIFGNSCLVGNVPGCQAEYVRVPLADINLYGVPREVSNEKAIFVSDVLASALHAVNLGAVQEGDVVAIWGLGPVGLMAGKWAKLRGAKRVIGIDHVPDRLLFAREIYGFETIDHSNISSQHVIDRLFHMLPLDKCSASGVDVAIEAAGSRYSHAVDNALEIILKMDAGSVDILTEMATCTRKCGRLVIIGDYIGDVSHFPMGHVAQKHLQIKAGLVPVQAYFHEIMKTLRRGEIDPTLLVTQVLTLEEAPEAYEKLFNAHATTSRCCSRFRSGEGRSNVTGTFWPQR